MTKEQLQVFTDTSTRLVEGVKQFRAEHAAAAEEEEEEEPVAKQKSISKKERVLRDLIEPAVALARRIQLGGETIDATINFNPVINLDSIVDPTAALKSAIEQIHLGLKSAASTGFLENLRCFHIGNMLTYIWVNSNKGGKFYDLLVRDDAESVARVTLTKVAMLVSADLKIGFNQVLRYGQYFSFCSKRQVFLLLPDVMTLITHNYKYIEENVLPGIPEADLDLLQEQLPELQLTVFGQTPITFGPLDAAGWM
jgi:hypothetical protein